MALILFGYFNNKFLSNSYISYFEQYREFDYFLAPPDYPNPWTSDNTELWEMK